MDGERAILRCHTCKNVQRDRRVYRYHLLRAHSEVSRRRLDAPVRLPERELVVVWASVRGHQVSEATRGSRGREELGFPRVSDREAERRLQDNRSRTARRHRAAARARVVAPAALGAPDDGDTRGGANGTGGATYGSARKLPGETSGGTGAHREGWRFQETSLPLSPMPQLRVSADPRLQCRPGLSFADSTSPLSPPSSVNIIHPPLYLPSSAQPLAKAGPLTRPTSAEA